MSDLPALAAWRHVESRQGFEVLFAQREEDAYRFEGFTTGLRDGEPWGIRYELVVDSGWATRTARIAGRTGSGTHEAVLEADGAGGWTVDGVPAPELAGCRDVDLEASAFTNALPVRRLGLDVGAGAEAPAAWVRAADLSVERLEQTYARVPDELPEGSRYAYEAPELGFTSRLVYDRFGLVVDYPGIAVRIA